MVSLLYIVGDTVVNATAFCGGNLAFIMLIDHSAEEKCKRNDLKEEELQRARDKWNEDRMKWLDFISKRLREKNEARAYISNADDAILKYYQLFAKNIKPLPPEPQLSNFYHP